MTGFFDRIFKRGSDSQPSAAEPEKAPAAKISRAPIVPTQELPPISNQPFGPMKLSLADTVERIRETISIELELDPGKRKIMFVSRGKRGTRWVQDAEKGFEVQRDEYAENVPEAVIEAALSMGWEAIIIYAGLPHDFSEQRPSYRTIYGNDVHEISFSDMGSAPANLRISTEGHFRDATERMLEDPVFSELFSHEGVDFSDQMRADIERALPAQSAQASAEYARWRGVFEACRPEAVIGGRLDLRIDMLQAAHDTQTLVGNVKLGIGEEMLFPFYLGDKDGEYGERLLPHINLLWGERQAAMLEKRLPGHPTQSRPVGRTRNDSFARVIDQPGDGGKALADHLGLSEKTEMIVYGANHRTFYARDPGDRDGTCCMSWMGYTSFLKALEAFAESRPDCRILVKPHPADMVAEIREFVEENTGERVHILTNEDGFHNADILRRSKLFVSSVSSMFSEALVSGSLPISVWTDDVNYLYESGRRDMFDNMAMTATSKAELTDMCARYLDDEALRQKDLKDLNANLTGYFGEMDGKNAVRAVQAVLDELSVRRPELAPEIKPTLN